MVHHRTHNSPPPVPVLSQSNPIHTPQTNLPKIHSDPIFPPTPRSSQWYLSFGLSHQNLVRQWESVVVTRNLYFLRGSTPPLRHMKKVLRKNSYFKLIQLFRYTGIHVKSVFTSYSAFNSLGKRPDTLLTSKISSTRQVTPTAKLLKCIFSRCI
jgi:hypothetical protein